jgi:excisionase family DNA binding protein
MKVPEVAELFDVDPETVRVWVREGKLRASRTPGGRVFVFRRADVDALLNEPASENEPAVLDSVPAGSTA